MVESAKEPGTSETDDSGISKQLNELKGLNIQKEKIDASYREVFPKVDPYFVHDIFLRMREDPTYKDKGPMYTVEVFTKEGTDSEASR